MAIDPQVNTAMGVIDVQTTRLGVIVETAGVLIHNLMNEISALPTTAEVQAIADRAKAIADGLTVTNDKLEAIAHDPRTPVPTPVPEPPPVPELTPDPIPVIVP